MDYLYSGTVLLLHRQLIFSGTASTNYTLDQHITSTSYYGLEQFHLEQSQQTLLFTLSANNRTLLLTTSLYRLQAMIWNYVIFYYAIISQHC